MTQELNNTEEIDALLKSSDIEDVILGCRIAAEYLGKEWCEEHLNGADNYRREDDDAEFCLLEFNGFYIWIGPIWIQYYIKHPGFDIMSDSYYTEHFKSFTTNT